MRFVYISNYKYKENTIETYSQTIESIQSELDKTYKDSDQEYIYILNVHCSYKIKNKDTYINTYFQNQGGIDIYRYLLQLYSNYPEKLKVVLFSPLTQNELVAIKPENIVIKKLPFIKQPIKEEIIEKIISEYENEEKWPLLNNASENLLSGYGKFVSLNNKINKLEKIKTKNRKILFLDDEQKEWEITLSTIFKENAIIKLPYSKKEYKNMFVNGLIDEHLKKDLNNILNNANLVLSDYYFIENHEPTNWKDNNTIKSISGFKLYRFLRQISPAIPIVLHTTSQKVAVFKVFNEFGLDDWLIKDTRYNATTDEKLENFIVFDNCIYKFLRKNQYYELNQIWEYILNIQKFKENKWWWNIIKNDESLQNIFNILKYSCINIRRVFNRQNIYEKEISGDSYDYFVPSSVCNNLGKILEILFPNNSYNLYTIPFILELIRNTASHSREYNSFNIYDSIIFLQLIIIILDYENSGVDFSSHFKRNKGQNIRVKENDICNEYLKYALLWIYLQTYENFKLDGDIKNKIGNRVSELYNKYKKNQEFERILNLHFIKYKNILIDNFSNNNT
jgi:hypothetical protein